MVEEARLTPLVVKLNGTLVRSDLLHEGLIRILRSAPAQSWHLLRALLSGRAAAKAEVARRAALNPASLPYRADLIAWLRAERDAGRPIVLCTGADRADAEAVARHLGLFSEVIASDAGMNLGPAAKARLLSDRYGLGGFDYAGNAAADLAIWQQARAAILVDASPLIARRAAAQARIAREFPGRGQRLIGLITALRPHQWLKNALIFVPLIAAHRLDELSGWIACLIGFAAFALAASSVYVVNDLADLESDRLHPRKSARPFAAGAVPVAVGFTAAPVLAAAALALALVNGAAFTACLTIYLAVTTAYSLLLKRIVLVDCVVLALLYTLRIIAGAAALGQPLTFWLLAFSVFLFLSLAFVKRYAELLPRREDGEIQLHGRGYRSSDAPIVLMLGVAAGYAASLVLALYLDSAAVLRLYRTPELMWPAVPGMIFWVSWIWLKAHRGEMDDDPLLFALKDRVSLAVTVFCAACLAAATAGIGVLA